MVLLKYDPSSTTVGYRYFGIITEPRNVTVWKRARRVKENNITRNIMHFDEVHRGGLIFRFQIVLHQQSSSFDAHLSLPSCRHIAPIFAALDVRMKTTNVVVVFMTEERTLSPFPSFSIALRVYFCRFTTSVVLVHRGIQN